MRNSSVLGVLAALALLLVPTTPALALVINNGLSPDDPANVIDSVVGEDVWVRNLGCPQCGGLDPDQATGVEVVAGAELGDLYVRENSHVGIRGGSLGAIDVSGVLPQYAQQIYVVIVGTGFTVDAAPVPYGPIDALSGTLAGTLESGDPLGSAFVQNSAGRIWLSLPLADVLVVNTSDQPEAPPTLISTPVAEPLVVSREACDEAWLSSYVLRPTCHLFGHPSHALLVTGGSVSSADVLHNAKLEVSGGSVSGPVRLRAGHLELRGGSIIGPIELSAAETTSTVHGTAFAVNGAPVMFGETTASSGTLTGTLESGETLSLAWTGGPLTLVRAANAPILPEADDDGDGVPNQFDNCLFVPNGPLLATGYTCDSQEDYDGDGYGQPCDADFDNDGMVGVNDLYRAHWDFVAPACCGPFVTDLNCSGWPEAADMLNAQRRLNTVPGPSGLSCAATGPDAPTDCTAGP
jgi:hypothetical protein